MGDLSFRCCRLAYRERAVFRKRRSYRVFTDLKLRASYGMTGNSQLPVYQSVSGLSTYNYIFGGQYVTGYGPSRIANPDLKWESTKNAECWP